MAYGKIQKRRRRNVVYGRQVVPRLLAAQKGYLRKGGYYGRYNAARFTRELKFKNLSLAQSDVSDTGTIIPSFNLIVQGVGEQERIGRQCTLKSIEMRLTVFLDPGTTALMTTDQCRFILYCDRQANGAAATPTMILTNPIYTGLYEMENTGRFQILWDKKVSLNSSCGSYDGAGDNFGIYEKSVHWKFNLNKLIQFSGATGAITEICCNNIGMLMITNRAQTNMAGRARVRFEG